MKTIQICGNLCSGKTTLSKILAENLNFKYIHAALDNSLIESFFLDTGKYFLQQQLSFLLNKAMQIHACVQNDTDMIIDRSIYEDIHIFASYFIENKECLKISQSDVEAYEYIASKILSNLPTTNIAIYCNTSIALCNKRLQNRKNNSYEKLYPKNHIENLHKEYLKKIESIKCEILLVFEGDKHDLLNPNTQKEISEEINSILYNESHTQFKPTYFTIITREENI